MLKIETYAQKIEKNGTVELHPDDWRVELHNAGDSQVFWDGKQVAPGAPVGLAMKRGHGGVKAKVSFVGGPKAVNLLVVIVQRFIEIKPDKPAPKPAADKK